MDESADIDTINHQSCTMDSQLSDIGDDFWSKDLHDMEIAEFVEDRGPCHTLDLKYHVL